jgi:pimeloyl-ACP methyl ester carboxylesterase
MDGSDRGGLAMTRHDRARPARPAAVLVLIAALMLSACSFGGKTKATATAPASTPTASASVPVTESGPANWVACPERAKQELGQTLTGFTVDCAVIKVPEDWQHPDNGKTFNIALDRVRSAKQTNRIGSLVVNPGGPGGSGVNTAIDLAQVLPAAITGRFDVVGFDPRGVGQSTEVNCFTAADQDALYAADPDPVSQAAFNDVVDLVKKAAAGCGTKYGDELPLFATEQAARDIDAVRAAVGDDKLNYLGYSYGTLLGATYAQLFPTHIRAMVLDGAIDPLQSLIARSQAQAAGFELAFSDFTKWCKANASKCPIAADPRGAVIAAMNAARQAPQTGADGRKATAGWILLGVAQAMYTQRYWPYLGQAIDNLSKGDSRLIFALADDYAERSASGTYSNLYDANDAVNCADFADQPTVAQVRTYQAQWRQKYPLFGAALATGLLTCAVGEWPGKSDPYPTGRAVGAPPIVVVGTTGDPATPYAQTKRLADMLGVGHVLTWQGEGHTAYPQTKCISDTVDAYLIDLTVPADGKTCPPA